MLWDFRQTKDPKNGVEPWENCWRAKNFFPWMIKASNTLSFYLYVVNLTCHVEIFHMGVFPKASLRKENDLAWPLHRKHGQPRILIGLLSFYDLWVIWIIFQIGYDDTFKNSFAGDNEINTYLNGMVVHVQAHFCLDSLGTKVKVEVNKDFSY